MAPCRLGMYELLQQIARGGMADVFLARDGHGRHVAVKILDAEHAADAESRALFADEARVLGLCDHPALARIHEVGEHDGAAFLAMDFVHGVDLRALMQRRDVVDFQTAIAIVAAAAAGLDHAHRRCDPDGRPLHVVHRDVSLSNIMVGYDGGVKVVDFGIARTARSLHATCPGTVRGKASYMSPEQALGDPVDRRTDVFALGVVLYELTCGRRCFGGASDFDRMLAAVRGEYVAPAELDPRFPPPLANAIATCLAIDPAQRFASAAALIDALDAVARAYGWTTDQRAIAEFMREVYGDVGDTLDEVGDHADEDEPTRGRRVAPKVFRAQFAA